MKLKSQKKTIEKLRKYGAESPLLELKEGAEVVGDVKLMSHVTTDSDKNTFEELIALGRKVFDMQKTVVILGCDYEGGKIIIARSKDLDINCRELAKEAGKMFGGGGGGKPEFAQAGGQIKDLEKAVSEIKKKVKEQM